MIDVPTKRIKSGLEHLDTPLNLLLSSWTVDRESARREAQKLGVKIEDESAHITILMRNDSSATAAVFQILKLGGTVTAHYGNGIEAWIPISRLEDVNSLDGISLAHRTIPPVPRVSPDEAQKILAGTYLTQGVTESNAQAWHAIGQTGQGVSIAFLDSFKDWNLAQSNGELPSSHLFSYGELNLGSRHGTACAEIIYDMAPGASITMASTNGGHVDHASKIVALAQLGHDVIGSSQAPVEPGPGDGSGLLANAIADAHDIYGSVYVQSAGNQAMQHWDGYFADADGDGVHEFNTSAEVNRLNPPVFSLPLLQSVRILLSWNDWPVSDQDFDLWLVYWNGASWDIAARSENQQSGTQPPWEELNHVVLIPGMYGVVINKYQATTSPFLDLMIHTGGVDLEYQVPSRSLDDIAAAPDAISAAAVDWASQLIEDYSSRGPTYGAGGSPSGGYAQPRLSGYANVDTWSYGPGVFNGTSSACPHVVGAAALVRGAYPTYSPEQTQTFLEGRAVDGGTPGYDYSYGKGVLWLGNPPASCTYSISPTSATYGAGGANGNFSVTTQAGCTWNATSNNNWIHVTGGASGTGSGTVSYSVDANGSSSSRTGTISAAGKTFTITQAGSGGGGSCTDDLLHGVVCLLDNRFEFQMTWTGFDGVTQPVLFARASDQTAAGVFQNNLNDITLVVKVTTGCSFNDHYWVWLGGFTNAAWRLEVTDTETGRSHVYTKQLSSTPPQTVKDETSFPCGSLAEGPDHGETAFETMAAVSEDIWGELLEDLPGGTTEVVAPMVGDPIGGAKLTVNCTDDLLHGVVCLLDNRFEFQMTWTGFDGVTQPVLFARASDQTAAGVFQNNLNDITLVVKVTTGCSFNNHYWVWLGGFTNAAWRLEVTDTETGRSHVYTKQLSSTPPQTVKDETSFQCP